MIPPFSLQSEQTPYPHYNPTPFNDERPKSRVNPQAAPWQQRNAQKKEQIFVCLPKKGYLCIL